MADTEKKRGRGRPAGAKNKKTIAQEKKVEEIKEMLKGTNGISDEDMKRAADLVIEEEGIPANTVVDDERDEYSRSFEPVGTEKRDDSATFKPVEKGSVKEKVLDGPDYVKKTGRPVTAWSKPNLPRTPSIIEILESVDKAPKTKRVELLSEYNKRQDVIYCLKAAFDERVQFTLPDGLPDNFVIGDDTTPDRAYDMAPERLIRVYKRMQYWVEGGSGQAKPQKREEIFLDTLRSLEKTEATFLNEIRMKKMPFKNITKELCEEAGFVLSPQ